MEKSKIDDGSLCSVKKTKPLRFLSKSIATLLCAVALPAPLALALPKGEKVTHGSATFERENGQLTIRAGNGSIINYQNFDIPRGEKVRFVQPGSSSRVLNRVLDGDPTRISGTLEANGRVYLANPAGIFFGSSAEVNVGSIVAGTGNMSDMDFVAGRDRFTNLSGQIVNSGQINATGNVALFGSVVTNLGSIVSQSGTVALAAGDEVLYGERGGNVYVSVKSRPAAAAAPGATAAAPAAVQQQGRIQGRRTVLTAGDVYSIAISPTSVITSPDITVKAGRSGTATVSGTLDASTARPGAVGGKVRITGGKVDLRAAHIDASGPAGGGEVLIGGDLHGKGTLANASTTTVDAATTVKADATVAGPGGKVVVWSDKATTFEGTISGQGAGAFPGGQAEVSGKATLAFRGQVNLLGGNGTAGTLLLDPADVTISSGPASGDGSYATPSPAPADPTKAYGGATASSVLVWGGAGGILSQLNAANVIITTSGSAAGDSGDITVTAGINYLSPNSLTLLAHRSVTVNAGAAITNSGTGDLSFFAGWDGVSAVTPALSGGQVSIAGDITLAGGNVSVTAGTVSIGNVSTGPTGGQLILNHSGAGSQRAGTVISGATSLVKAGTGTLTLGGNNTYKGTTTISGGVLVAGNLAVNTALGGSSSLGTSDASAGNLVFDGGTLRSSATTASTARNFSITAGHNAVFDVPLNTQRLTLSGVGSGSGGLTKVGNGTLVLGDANSLDAVTNSYSGDTTVADGVLTLGHRDRIPGNLVVTGDQTIFDLNGFDETVNGLAGTGIVDNFSTSKSSTLTVGQGGASSVFSGLIRSTGDTLGTGSLSLTKTGNGSLTLSGRNLYTGVTIISGGTLSAQNDNALGASTAKTIVDPSATLDLTGGVSLAEPITLSGSVASSSGANLLTGALTLPANSTPAVSVAEGSSLELDAVTGPLADLTAANLGTLQFGKNTTSTTSLHSVTVSGTLLGKPDDLQPNTIVAGTLTTSNGQTYNQTFETAGNATLTELSAAEIAISGRLSPGGKALAANLTVNGNLTLQNGSTLYVTLLSGGQDHVTVTGSHTTTLESAPPGVTPNGVTLDGFTPDGARGPAANRDIVVLTTPLRSGNFVNIPAAGGRVIISDHAYDVTYATPPPNGNVTLNRRPDTRTWDGGGGADNRWSTDANWTGAGRGVQPSAGDTVIFGAAANGTLISVMDISDLALAQLQFTGGGNIISRGTGNLVLSGVGAILNVAGNNTVNAPITLTGATTFQVSAGTLTIGGAVSSDTTNGAQPSLAVTGSGNLAIGTTITTTGPQSYAIPVAISANSILDANASSIDFGGALAVGDHDLTLRANAISFPRVDPAQPNVFPVTGTGNLAFEGGEVATAIALNGGVVTGGGHTLQISQATYAAVGEGFSSITFGRAAGTGDINAGALILKANTTFQTSSDANNIGTISLGAVDGPYSLTVATDAKGSVAFTDAIGAGTELAKVEVKGGGTLTLSNGGRVTTSGSQTYDDKIILKSDTAFTGLDLTFNKAIVDDKDALTTSILTVTSDQTTFAAPVGFDPTEPLNQQGALKLTSLTSEPRTSGVVGSTLIEGGLVLTTGAQTYNTAVDIQSTTTALMGADFTFSQAVVLNAPTTLTGAKIQFDQVVDIKASATVSGTDVTFSDAVNIGATTIVAGTDVTFSEIIKGTIGAPSDLTVSASGTTTFGGAVGATVPLTSLKTDGGGTTMINGGVVTTSRDQTYDDAVLLGADLTLTGDHITLKSAVDNARPTDPAHPLPNATLTLDATGESTLGGLIGNVSPLGSLTVKSGSGIHLDVPSGLSSDGLIPTIRTTGAQTYFIPVLLGGDANLKSDAIGDIDFKSTVASDGTAYALKVRTDGMIIFEKIVGGNGSGAGALLSLETGGADGAGSNGSTQFFALSPAVLDANNKVTMKNPSVTTLNGQTYLNAVVLNATTGLLSLGNGEIRFGSTVNALSAFDRATGSGQGLFIQSGNSTTFQGDVGSTMALSFLLVDSDPRLAGGPAERTVLYGKINTSATSDFGLIDFANPVQLNSNVQIGRGDTSATNPIPFATGEVFFHSSIVSNPVVSTTVSTPLHADLTIATAGRVTLAGNVGTPAGDAVPNLKDPAGRLGNLTINQPLTVLPTTTVAFPIQPPPTQPTTPVSTVIRLGGFDPTGDTQSATYIATTGAQIYNGVVLIKKTVNLYADSILTTTVPATGSVSIRDGIYDEVFSPKTAGSPPPSAGTLNIITVRTPAGGLSESATNLDAGDVYIGGPVGDTNTAGLATLNIDAGHNLFVRDVNVRDTLVLGGRDKLYLIGDDYKALHNISFNPAGHTTFDLKSTIIHNNPGPLPLGTPNAAAQALLRGPDTANLTISGAQFRTGYQEALYVDAGSLAIKAGAVRVGDVAAATTLAITSPSITVIPRPATHLPTAFGPDLGTTLIGGQSFLPSSEPYVYPATTGQQAFQVNRANSPTGANGPGLAALIALHGPTQNLFFQHTFDPDQPLIPGVPLSVLVPTQTTDLMQPFFALPEVSVVTTAPVVKRDGDEDDEAAQAGLLDPALKTKLLKIGIAVRKATPEELAELRRGGSTAYRQPIEGMLVTGAIRMQPPDYAVVLNRVTLQEVQRVADLFDEIGGRSRDQQRVFLELLEHAKEKAAFEGHGKSVDGLARWLVSAVKRDTEAADTAEMLRRFHGGYVAVSKLGLTKKETEISNEVMAENASVGVFKAGDFEKLILTSWPARTGASPFKLTVPPTPMPAGAQSPPEPVAPQRLDIELLEPETGLPLGGEAAPGAPLFAPPAVEPPPDAATPATPAR